MMSDNPKPYNFILKQGVKEYFRYVINMLCVIFSFLMGRCSYARMRAYIRGCMDMIRNKLTKYTSNQNLFNGKRMLTLDEAQRFISEAIESNTPFMAGRFGTVELGAIRKVRDDNKGLLMPVGITMRDLCNNAGFFPEDKNMLPHFAEVMRDATRQADLIGIRGDFMEEYECKVYAEKAEFCHIESLEPFFASESWTSKLENKRVLVIHPFEDTIRSQYKRRELLFPGTNILPKFELITQRAVQTIAFNKDERFNTWFDALDYMHQEAMKKDFDVAIIGCGAYGFPLAAMIKQSGKIAIHLGGVTQMVFGIKGFRWENMSKYKELVSNPNWVNPQERPEDFINVEGGCYW